MKCRHCGAILSNTLIDLFSSPPSNSYLTVKTIKHAEKWYPLKVLICEKCWLVQTEDFVGVKEMFNDEYAYFSSFSKSWLSHVEIYVDNIVERFKLNNLSNVIEVAANDGYLLEFIQEKQIPCYGIEPTHSTAVSAKNKGIEIVEDFFGIRLALSLAAQSRKADLMIANNVLAHVPNINDFVQGFSLLLNESGVATFEFPHLLNLIVNSQFDTIYHEHYSYLSITSVVIIFQDNGLEVFDVDELPTHGGSLRVYAQRIDTGKHTVSKSVNNILKKEAGYGMNTLDFYKDFHIKAEESKFDLLHFLINSKGRGQKVIAYGAAAKGNTILNFCGIKSDLVPFVVDKNPNKIGKYMPGSHIPIVEESLIKIEKPKYILILPWNLKDEVTEQLSYIRDWGGEFVVATPKLEIF
jgi:hypothetical protein